MSASADDWAVREHYERPSAVEAVLVEIASNDCQIDPALDHFHVGGAAATQRLAEKAGLAPGARVLDVGSGLGGPARQLADAQGWDVTGIDLTPGFCRVAQALSRRNGLGGSTRFCAADAMRLPFADDAFDGVWTEHVAMNISARDALYAELLRIVRPGGRLALFDVVAGENNAAPLDYPVPWSRDRTNSHLVTADGLKQVLAHAGWGVCVWDDETEFARDWLESAKAPRGGGRPSLRSLIGNEFPKMVGNLRANFSDGRLGAIQAVLERTA